MSATLFLTAHDPQATASGSIDPLGTLQSYGALADLLLPGVTTITTRSRYLTMICAALLNAEKHRAFPPGPAGRSARRKAVEPFERLWALACIAAERRGEARAATGLRGVRDARNAFETFRGSGRFSPDFRMLKYQDRTGAIGTYWTALASSKLIDPGSGCLLPEGRELAEAFPPFKEGQRDLTDPGRAHNVVVPTKELEEWGKKCHLAAAARDERRLLAEALRADPRRECIARALVAYSNVRLLPTLWDARDLRQFRASLVGDDDARSLGLPEVIDGIIALEAFHEAALSVFEDVLWWATEKGAHPIGELVDDALFLQKASWLQQQSLAFLKIVEVPAVRSGIESMKPFAAAVAPRLDVSKLLDEVLRWHERVQSGKLDGGVPKREWVTRVLGGKLLRPAPQFQRTSRTPAPSGHFLTHPYRLEPFAGMLIENGTLPNRFSEQL